MLDLNYVKSLIEEFAASPYGKEEVKKKTGVEYISKKGSINSKITKYLVLMKDILFGYISSVIKSFDKEDIVIGDVVTDKSGMVTGSLSLKNTFRESLAPNTAWDGNNVGWVGGTSGILNIVLHFHRGWNARGAVHGLWHGQETWGRRSYDANSFLQDAVNEFNNKTGGTVTAKLVGDYA